MLKRILAIAMVICLSLCFSACGDGTPDYPEQSFEISGFWAPYEITEESFKQYKDAGFTTLAMINHSLGNTSEEQFYLGSKRTMKALEICKKVGLKAILNYNDWKAEQCEGVGYNGETPFSKYDLYGDYKDIITGVHIVDEPSVHHYDQYADKTLMDDFKKVYPDAYYIVNLSPKYAGGTYWDFVNYDELVNTYEEKIMTYFDNKFISVDCYPFCNEEHREYPRRTSWLSGHEIIANLAKKHDAYKTAIIQSSVGNEFAKELTEGDMRLQVNIALAFGFDHIQYYCYEVPKAFNEDGTVDNMYGHCILNQDSTPNEMYYWVKDINKEIQSYSSAILAYDWDTTTVVNGSGVSTNGDIFTMMLNEFENPEYYEKGIAVKDFVISRFVSEEYGEAYMLVNYGPKDETNLATITFKNCEKIAIYGGKGFDGKPEIYELDEEGKFVKEFEYGDGVFVVPLA